ncbi:MAG: antibiotic biosynthesis monooxygenase [bacterium]
MTYIVMNRFQVTEGHEGEFEELWLSRESFLKEVDGFKMFHLLRGDDPGEYISHTIWESKEAFEGWIGSESFVKAHARAGKTPKEIFGGPPKLSEYEVLMTQKK